MAGEESWKPRFTAEWSAAWETAEAGAGSFAGLSPNMVGWSEALSREVRTPRGHHRTAQLALQRLA